MRNLTVLCLFTLYRLNRRGSTIQILRRQDYVHIGSTNHRVLSVSMYWL